MKQNIPLFQRQKIYVLMNAYGKFLCARPGRHNSLQWTDQIGLALRRSDPDRLKGAAFKLLDKIEERTELRSCVRRQLKEIGIFSAEIHLDDGAHAKSAPSQSAEEENIQNDFVRVIGCDHAGKLTYLSFSSIGRPAYQISKARGFRQPINADSNDKRRVIMLNYYGSFTYG